MPEETTTATFPTAAWCRADQEIRVIKLNIPNTWIGDSGSCRAVVGDSKALQIFCSATLLCLNPKILLWIEGQPDSPPSIEGSSSGSGSLLVAHKNWHFALKEWREVRRKLRFKPSRIEIPTYNSLRMWRQELGHPVVGRTDGIVEHDGSTTRFSFAPPSLRDLARIFWDLHEDRRELIDYSLADCCDCNCALDLYFYYSSFKDTYRYAFESDEQVRQRIAGALKPNS